MKLSALVFDLDGTAIPKQANGMPSKKVVEAVQKAKQVCHVSIATGRPLRLSEQILEALQIEDLCILNGGAQLYSRKAKQFVWKQEVEATILQELFAQLKAFGQYMVEDERPLPPLPLLEYAAERVNESVGLSCIFAVSIEDAKQIVSIVKKFSSLTAHSVSSWTEGTWDIHITHELATKKHALQALLAHLNVQVDEVMVVGDGGNDLPLFELAGWKVAMGNAAEELKAQADWIAPTVDEDGLAVAIEKFVMGES